MSGSTDEFRRPRKLSDEQRVVARWRTLTEVLCVIAKAGTGKTTAAGALIASTLAEGSRVLGLGFARNGVGQLVTELRREHGLRIFEKTKSYYSGRALKVATFDSFIFRSLRELGVAEVSWETASVDWHVRTLASMAADTLVTSLPKHFSRPRLIRQLRQVIDLIERDQPLDPAIADVVKEQWEALRRRAAEERLLLRDDKSLLIQANARRLADLVIENFDVIVIDECQDCSWRDLAFLEYLARRCCIALLGDPGQSLMGFRGALADIAEALASRGVAVHIATLTINFRSDRRLVAAQNSLQLAAGWTGPLAVPDEEKPEGVQPVVLVLPDETAMVEALCAGLAMVGLAPHRLLERSPVAEPVLEVLWEQAAAIPRRTTESGEIILPSDEIIVPSNKTGRLLCSALIEREIDAMLVLSAANPFDGRDSTLLRVYCGPEGLARTNVSVVMSRHLSGARLAADTFDCEEIDACASDLFAELALWPEDAPVQDVLRHMGKAAQEMAGNDVLTDAGIRYCTSLHTLTSRWQESLEERDLANIMRALAESVVAARAHPVSRGRIARSRGPESGTLPWLFRELVKGGKAPHDVGAWLDDNAARWRMPDSAKHLAPEAVPIKTDWGAKGDTVDQAWAYGGERLPGSPRRDRFGTFSIEAAAVQDRAVAYVPASRARHSYVMLCWRSVPRYHEVALAGWTYVTERGIWHRDRP